MIDRESWILNVGLRAFWPAWFQSPRPAALFAMTAAISPPRIAHLKTLRAFTLIEVLIAIALILALVGTMYGFFFDVLATRARVLEHVRQETAASALIKQLDADLATCIVGDSLVGSGIQGDHHRIRVLSRGVSASLATRGVGDPVVFGDLQLAEYRFDSQNHVIEGRRAPAFAPNDGLPEFSPLEGEIFKLRFRYHDGRQWRSEFDSRIANSLPRAVEVSIWYRAAVRDASHRGEEEMAGADELVETEGADATADLPPPSRLRLFIITDGGASSPTGETGDES